ncbi:TRAP transporter substrate-binding protein [Lacimicrobium alkaliphilum]|uniref:C4-dicarboxylate ABC transporter substrate-binding protein n=1 Tax=Lacimicrobium alkaliphilum TaxID=1526571 RepID=A0A0U3AWN9_9ALTE|nr:TRAP transporter substrate-binding protein [Lacimicrobium alkaliphilum]ALS97312.1 C4-dicarboxylate ABC transporter substrate-binding protein [Lacimicrobium alkaliphilum]
MIVRKLIPSLLILTLLSACKVQDDRVILRLGHALDTQHTVHKAMQHFGERLQQYSDGQMQVMIYPSSQLGSEREMVELLQIGSLAMTKVSASPLEGFVPQMKLFSIPYVFRDREHFWKVLDSDIGQQILSGVEKMRLKGLAYYDAGSRSFYTNDVPVHSPEDLKGLKIRVLNSPTAVKTVQALGGSATPVSWGELYTALQQGVVDGAENNPPSYYLSRHYEISRYYSLDEHTSVPDVILASKAVWDGLTPEQQGWVEQAMADSVEYQKSLWQQASDEALEAVKAAGVEVIYPDKQAFREAVAPFHASLADTEVGRLIQRIKQM